MFIGADTEVVRIFTPNITIISIEIFQKNVLTNFVDLCYISKCRNSLESMLNYTTVTNLKSQETETIL